jgi:hypothetical protein
MQELTRGGRVDARLLKTRDPAEAGPRRLRLIAYVYMTASLRSFDALKAIPRRRSDSVWLQRHLHRATG